MKSVLSLFAVILSLLFSSSACLGADISITTAIKELDKLGLQALAAGNNLKSQRKLDAGVERIVSRFKSPTSLFLLVQASLKEYISLRCDANLEIRRSGFMAACEYAITALGRMRTAESTRALQKVSRLVSDNGQLSLAVHDCLELQQRMRVSEP